MFSKICLTCQAISVIELLELQKGIHVNPPFLSVKFQIAAYLFNPQV